ncbi:MAG: putative glycosyltransferase [Candidatus Saccharibacteria bacterium]|nr:putative glycosyltransferase [Candidatus Saccharibacteria bacterium]
MEQISVIVPVFNTEEYLARCIDSILNQTYTNLDVILIDDGSTDKSGDICDQYATKDSRVRVIHGINRGVSHARNIGINIARGEYISFVDADDVIASGYFEMLHRILKDNNSDISTSGTMTVYDLKLMDTTATDHSQAVDIMSGVQATKSMLYQNKLSNSPFAKLYSKKLFDTIKFNENLVIAEDLDLNYQLILRANTVAVNLARNYFYFQRPGSAMQSTFSLKRTDGLTVAKRLMSHSKLHYPAIVNSAKNRLFIEAVLVATEISYANQEYKKQFNECIDLIRNMRYDVLHDNESRFRFRFYAGISFVNVHILILLFVVKKISKKFLINLKNWI